MSRINWTNELELSFIEHFQSEPCLWNINLRDYKNKLKNHDAWKRISSLMEIPIEELKTKKNSLLASYRMYRNKVKESEASGASADDIYQPIWFAYESMDAFLGDTTKCKNTVNTVTQSAYSEDHTEPIGFEEDQSEQSQQADDQNQTVNTNATAVTTIRRRKNPTELSEAGRVMKEALSTFNATVKRNESISIPKEDDDCDLYAKLMAKKLRRLPENKRFRLMHAIDGMFLNSQYTIHTESLTPIPISPEPQHDQYQPRPGTSSSSHSEPIMHHSTTQTPSPQPQYANKLTRSRNLTYDQYQPRPGTSSSSHSEPIMHHSPTQTPSPQPQYSNKFTRSRNLSYDQYQPRPGTSSSSHSEPIMYHSPTQTPSPQPQHAQAFLFPPIAIQNSNAHNRYRSSNIIIQSNDALYPPVIHIPEQNTSAETNTEMTNEDTVVVTNIIEKAFNAS